jgi:hypothetical protein
VAEVAETLAAEQEYFDFAWHDRERMRRSLRDAPAAAANAGAAVRIRKDADRRLERIGQSGAAVAVGDGGELVAAPAGDIGAFGEVLTEQSIGVLVRAALPWAVWIGEVNPDSGVDAQLSVLGELWCRVSFAASTPVWWLLAFSVVL